VCMVTPSLEDRVESGKDYSRGIYDAKMGL
jgi:hypothetical protein